MPAGPLAEPAIRAALAGLPGWRRDGDALVVTWRFPAFRDAMAWMQDCALDIDRLDHHPDWRNLYDRVEVRLCTHDAGDRITAKDVELAKILAWRAEAAGASAG